MRPIDADALVSALNNGRLKEQTGRAVPFNAGVAFALTMVEYAQTIDAVPVVRCKDCKHCNTDWAMGKWYGSCKIWNTHSVMADWYCVNGERRYDETD